MATTDHSPGDNVNSQYDPTEKDAKPELVLNVLKTEPLPTVTPERVVNRTHDDFNKYHAHRALKSLADAGWVLHRDHGLYDLITDPRDDVANWPVSWENIDTLPDPHPEAPDPDQCATLHAYYTRRND